MAISDSGDWQLDQLALAALNTQLGHLGAQRVPWQRRVDIDDVAFGAVSHPTQRVLARSVGKTQGDERTTQVVLTATPQPETIEVSVKLDARHTHVAVLPLCGGNDEIVAIWQPSEHLFPAAELPLGEDTGEHRMDRDPARYFGLDALLLLRLHIIGRVHAQHAKRSERYVIC